MFSLYARIAVAAAIALALAASHWKAYTKGRDVVRAEWALDAAERTQAALAASEAARKVEQELTAKVGRIDRAYQNQKRATASAVAAASVGVRDFEAVIAAPATASSDATPSCGANGSGSIERELLGKCAAALAGMGAEADRLAGRVLGLQDYVKTIQP